ncbi:serine/threonine protein kinase [Microbispora sp. NEAU-D428]|uniref:serine/threonine-protein kinase n=1 Tax=Microbispora sitophila TaxID=2771537 RepID=UPI0018692A1C|nr:serine/threonine-protein kinase [Microbispora sitophila]MBE3010534.1 serine/threonine protein kinase [Microbispora sitophila]
MGTAGQLIVRRYRLVRALGHGRTGLVWEGRDTLLDRPVAIREVLLPPDLGESARLRLVQRISREARQAERLRHPHIAAVYDVAEEGDTPYVVTELVPSRSLDGVVSGDGPLPPAEAARIARTVLSALTHAHAAGVRHGDVRPANVLLAHDGRVLLADFGVSMLATDPAFARDPVPSGPPVGRATETYLAPERAAGGPRTVAADLWSLGATLHLAVTGRPPRGQGPPEDVPGEVRAVLTGLLAREPRRRIDAETADRLLAEIEPPASPQPVRRGPGRTRLITGIAAAVLIACAVGGWAVLRPGGESRAGARAVTSVTPSAPVSPSASASPSVSASAQPSRRLKLKWHTSDAGWRAGVPRDWTLEERPYSTSWRSREGGATFTVEVTAQRGTDPLAALGEAEEILRPAAKAYRKLRLRAVTGEHGPSADWEFTWTPRKASARDHLAKGVEYHQYRRVISTGTTTSVLTWTTPTADWDALRPTLVRVLALFQPPSLVPTPSAA